MTRQCAICGKDFEPRQRNHIYCGYRCRLQREYDRRKGIASVKVEQERAEMTELTPYLCQKWRREGMAVRQIADILRRSTESVRKALDVPLAPEEYRKMEEYRR